MGSVVIIGLAVLASLVGCTPAARESRPVSTVRYVRADSSVPALGSTGILIVCATTFPRDTVVPDVVVRAEPMSEGTRTNAQGCAQLALKAGPIAVQLARMEYARANVPALVRAGFADTLYVRLERHGLPTPAACRAAAREGRPCR